MSRQRFLWLVIAAVVAVSLALVWSGRRNAATPTVGGPLLPTLAPVANSISAVTVRRASATPTVTVHQQPGGGWTVGERGDYPADLSKVRKLVIALTDAKIVEEKTSDPAKFPQIGVEDPSGATASGAEIVVTAKDGKHALIVGKPAGEGNFARRGGENVSYLISPPIYIEAEPKYWLDTQLLDIATNRIRSVEVKPASAAGYSLHRAAAPADAAAANGGSSSGGSGGSSSGGSGGSSSGGSGGSAAPSAGKGDATLSGDFSLDAVPAGRKAAEASTLAPSPSTLSGLVLDDVSPASNVDFTKPSIATLTLADGSVMTVTGTSSGDKHWIEVHSSVDAALNAKASGRAFEIPGYRYDAIFRPLEQLLVPKEPPPSAKGKAGAAGTAGAMPPARPSSPPGKKPQATPVQ